MSDASLGTSASPPVHIGTQRRHGHTLSPLEALERGFALFRSTFSREAWRYCVGAVPLVICFIPIWVMNGQIRISSGALLIETALLSAAYLLRVSMVGSYVRHVREGAFNTPIMKPVGGAEKAATAGRLLAWKIVLGGASVFALPTFVGAAWFYGACQFAGLEASDHSGERRSLRNCLSLSSQWLGAGLVLFWMLLPLWGAVWINGALLALILPQLLHSIFGLNTLLSTRMGVWALIQSSAFWLSLLAAAWLAVDPIVKCTYIVVFQHLRSRREGDDLRGALARLPRVQGKKTKMIASDTPSGRLAKSSSLMIVAVLTGVLMAMPVSAAQVATTSGAVDTAESSAREARIERLRTALNQESQRSIYQWHDAEHPTPPTWFDRLMTKIGNSLERAWNAIRSFFNKLWPSGLNLSLGEGKRGGWQLKRLRFWVMVIAILTLLTGGVLFWLRRRREDASLAIPMEVAPILDLSDTSVAVERSEDEWFALALRLEKEGSLRMALRASYLGLLAGLAQRECLTIRRDRTNREYLNEFTRRWLRRPQVTEKPLALPDKLRGSLRQFDRVWYGLHVVTPEAVAAYLQDQREFLNHV